MSNDGEEEGKKTLKVDTKRLYSDAQPKIICYLMLNVILWRTKHLTSITNLSKHFRDILGERIELLEIYEGQYVYLTVCIFKE